MYLAFKNVAHNFRMRRKSGHQWRVKKKKKVWTKFSSLKKEYCKSMRHEGYISSLCVDVNWASLESEFSIHQAKDLLK